MLTSLEIVLQLLRSVSKTTIVQDAYTAFQVVLCSCQCGVATGSEELAEHKSQAHVACCALLALLLEKVDELRR
jgi:hypothetical protein